MFLSRSRKHRRPRAPPPSLLFPTVHKCSAVINEYAGAPVEAVERVDMATISPEAFFDRFVTPRVPAVLVGYVSSPFFAVVWTAPCAARALDCEGTLESGPVDITALHARAAAPVLRALLQTPK